MEVTGFEPVAPALRTLRPHPSDRAICALTWGIALIAPHRFAWFRSVSRTGRARPMWPVRVSAMLHSVDQNDLVVFEDLVDDAVFTPSRQPETLESTRMRSCWRSTRSASSERWALTPENGIVSLIWRHHGSTY